MSKGVPTPSTARIKVSTRLPLDQRPPRCVRYGLICVPGRRARLERRCPWAACRWLSASRWAVSPPMRGTPPAALGPLGDRAKSHRRKGEPTSSEHLGLDPEGNLLRFEQTACSLPGAYENSLMYVPTCYESRVLVLYLASADLLLSGFRVLAQKLRVRACALVRTWLQKRGVGAKQRVSTPPMLARGPEPGWRGEKCTTATP